MDKILHRRLAALTFVDPDQLLSEIGPTIIKILRSPESLDLSARERNVRLELHQAAFLSFMVKHLSGPWAKVTFCMTAQTKDFADEDFDCVLRLVSTETAETVYKLVQLKQLPDAQVNLAITLQSVLNSLRKYSGASDLIVAIWINRDIQLDFEHLDFRDLKIETLWLFGDSVTGEITLDGGHVSELLVGKRWSGFMRNRLPTIRPVKFVPFSSIG